MSKDNTVTKVIKDLIGPEKFAAVKALLKFSEEPVVPEPKKFTEAKLKDGSVVMIDGELKEGAMVMVVVDGVESPAPDGDHELEDGTLITVAGGAITAIKKAEASTEEMEQAKKDAEAAKQAATQATEVANKATAAIEEMKKVMEAQTKTIDEFKASQKKQEEFSKQLFALVEKIADAPIGEPVERQDESKPMGNVSMSEIRKQTLAFRKELEDNRLKG